MSIYKRFLGGNDMKCSCCGAEIVDGVKECPYCNSEVLAVASKEEMKNQISMPQKASANVEEPENGTLNSLVGKKYYFVSTRGTNFTGLLNSRILSDVEVREERLLIEMKPKKFNVFPSILFEDIADITVSKNINFYYWVYIIVSAVAGFAIPFCFILTLLFIYNGLQRKITITQKNGKAVNMYTGSKSLAEEFEEDMKKVTKIQ